MAWLESHTVVLRHRKLLEFARALRLRPSHAMGHLHALWHAALEQQEDGDLSSWSDELIAELSDFPGDAPQYVRLLQKHGWFGYRDSKGELIPDTAKLIHDWLDYAGKWLRGKYSKDNKSRLVAIWRKHGRSYGEHSESSRDPSAFQQTPDSNPTTPNLTHPPNPPTNRDGGGGGQNGTADVLAIALRAAGVRSEGKVRDCVDVAKLTPAAVALEALDLSAKGKINDVGAVLASRLTDSAYVAPTLLTPKDVSRLAKAIGIESVAGKQVCGKLRQNEDGIYFVNSEGNEVAIPRDQLKPESIVLAWRTTTK